MTKYELLNALAERKREAIDQENLPGANAFVVAIELAKKLK